MKTLLREEPDYWTPLPHHRRLELPESMEERGLTESEEEDLLFAWRRHRERED
jgi:hypothetical protein